MPFCKILLRDHTRVFVLLSLLSLIPRLVAAQASFAMEIHGAIERSLAGEALLRPMGQNAVITLDQSKTGDVVLLSIPQKIKAGVYVLDSWSGAYESGTCRDYGFSFSTFRSAHDHTLRKFESVISGTLTIDSTAPISGRFSATVDGGLEGVIAISGSFSSLGSPEILSAP